MKDINDIPKQNSFQVPDQYFDNLSYQIKDRIDTQEAKPKVAWAGKRRIVYYSLVAVTAIVFLLYMNPYVENVVPELTSEDVYILIEDDYIEIDDDIIEDYYTDELMAVALDVEDDVIDYLLNEDIDISDIEDEF